MRIRNTSRYPTDEVREIVKWACAPIDMHHVCVNVKGSSRSFRGMAYQGVPTVSNAPATSEYLVTVGIGAESSFPILGHRYPGKSDRFPSYDLHDWREALVLVTAHEAAHIEQFREDVSHSELRAETFAVRRLNEWRKMRAVPA